jgi:hypothetical protein
MFDEMIVELTAAEHDAYVIACLETEFDEEYPDPADFVTDERQRFLDSRIRLQVAGAAHLDSAAAANRAISVAAATRAFELTEFARSRPAAMFDRAPGELGAAAAASIAARPEALTEVSEWAVDELAATLRVSGRTASQWLADAITLVEKLPGTYAVLRAGDISPAHAQAMVEIAGVVSTPEKRAAVEAAVLPRAPAQSVAAFKPCIRRAVLRIDAEAATKRLAKAARERKVRLDGRDDGMSTMTTLLTTPVARACYEALSAYAKACEFDEDGNRDPRTHQQRMADCFADLLLRPHADRAPVQIALTLVASSDTLTGHGPGADEPGELEGDLVPAAMVRELAHAFGLLPRPERDEPPRPASAGASDSAATPAEEAEGEKAEGEVAEFAEAAGDTAAAELAAVAGDRARKALTRLLEVRKLADTALAERPRIAITDPLSGALLALTDAIELRSAAESGRGLGPPCGTDAYRPTDPLYRFVRLRDRRCRFPGCRARARCCDLDHQLPHPHGPTSHDNLACLCEHHHRLSHQAPGWRLHREPDGALVWTLPSGRTITTRPPAFGTDDGSTPRVTDGPTARERYRDTLDMIRTSRPVPADPLIPY